MCDIWNIHDLWLMYSTYATNGTHMECSHSRLMHRTCQHYRRLSEHQEPTKHRPEATYVQLELISPLLILQPSGKFRKTLIQMENRNPMVPILWEHSLTNLLGHDSSSDPGIAHREWVHFQGVQNILDLLSWDQEELKAIPAQEIYSLMTMVRVYISGPTKLNICVGS